MAFFTKASQISTSSEDLGFHLRSPPPSLHLKRILANYPEGTQLLKEALQNADDAQATTFSVTLDERRFVCPEQSLERFMGASLVLYNNATFNDLDWVSLQNMFQSEKLTSLSKIGKFGMGSRSYFHMTDVMFIVSGSCFAFMDPDQIISSSGGERFDYVLAGRRWEQSSKGIHQERLRLLKFHLSVFQGMRGFDMHQPFPGTLIRLPLRLAKFARTSRFAPYEYTADKVRRILKNFEAEIPDSLLFLQSCNTIEVSIWPEGDDVARLSCTGRAMSRPVDNMTLTPSNDIKLRGSSPIKRLLSLYENLEQLETHLLEKSVDLEQAKWDQVIEIVMDAYSLTSLRTEGAISTTSSTWLVLQRLTTSIEVTRLIKSVQTAPIIGLAAIINPNAQSQMCDEVVDGPESLDALTWPYSECEGKVYTFLPLNDIETNLRVHLHGNFCLTENRRSLWLSTANDTEGQAKDWTDWNKSLLYDSLPDLYAEVLCLMPSEELLFANWPSVRNTPSFLLPFFQRLSAILKERSVMFGVTGVRHKPCQTRFLHLSDTTSIAFAELLRCYPEINSRAMLAELRSMAHTRKNQIIVAAPRRVKDLLDLTQSEPRLTSISFLALMHNVILPVWNEQNVYQLRNAPFLLHWMLILCKTLGKSQLEEVSRFRLLCDELRFVPVSLVLTQHQLGLMSDAVTDPEDEDRSLLIHRTVAEADLHQERVALTAPVRAFDNCLKGFKVAAKSLPIGPFGSPSSLRVLRQWGLKQTLTWTDMTQELVIRVCNAETIVV